MTEYQLYHYYLEQGLTPEEADAATDNAGSSACEEYTDD
jgi:hypothetical protein